MGVVTNVLEDFENYIINLLNEKRLTNIRNEEEKLQNLSQSLEYRKADIIYLTMEGFEYDKNTDKFSKEENIDYGRYPGTYRISITFPNDYPKSPPDIRCKPLKVKKKSSHIYSDGSICLAEARHGEHQTYWKSNMNARGALQLVYHLITDELHIKKKTRKELPINNNIYGDLMKVVKKEVFIKEFIKPRAKEIDNTYTWGELAYVTSKFNPTKKQELVDYYNSKDKKK